FPADAALLRGACDRERRRTDRARGQVGAGGRRAKIDALTGARCTRRRGEQPSRRQPGRGEPPGMTAGAYEIARFRPEHREGVLAALAGLWPYGPELCARFFEWRHVENPSATGVLGIVALHQGKPVVF